MRLISRIREQISSLGHVSSPQPLRLAIRLLDYPAWHVEVNGRRVTPESPESTGQIFLPLPAGAQRIRIEFMKTSDRKWGEAVSGAAGILFLLLFFLDRAKRRSAKVVQT